jgi:rhamnosyltransferase
VRRRARSAELGKRAMTVVAGVVVAFRPELDKLERLLRALSGQVQHLIVVDNGADDELGAWLEEQAFRTVPVYVPLRDNTGIGAAQNVGIRLAGEQRATHVVLFDQDSMPMEDMVSELLTAEETMLDEGIRVGAVGPQLYDEQTRHPFRFVQFAWGLKRWADTADADTEWLETHHLVASGTMIRASVIEEVGLLREDLFLEYVDVEWGLRARAKGYLSFGLKSIPLHSPLRHYYTMRNAVRMQLLPYVPPEWKVHDALRTAATFCIFGCFNAPRFAQVAMMLRGFRDGLVGRMGRYQG